MRQWHVIIDFKDGSYITADILAEDELAIIDWVCEDFPSCYHFEFTEV